MFFEATLLTSEAGNGKKGFNKGLKMVYIYGFS